MVNQATIDEIVTQYTNAYADPKGKVKDIAVFDSLRKKSLLDTLAKADVAQDPWEKDKIRFSAMSRFREEMSYFIGEELKAGETIADDEVISTYVTAGIKYLNKKFNVKE